MDYAYLFSGMGVTIIYLAYKNYMLDRNNSISIEIITAIADGELTVKRTKDGIEAVSKKGV
jgi:UDP-N-acetyl-D-mannosaminuronate dehydrogenase